MLKIIFEIALSPLYFFMQWLAEENVLFTTVKEGTVKTVMRGKSFERHIMSFQGYHLNDPQKKFFDSSPGIPSWEVIYHGKNNKNGYLNEKTHDAFYDDRPPLLKNLGLYWVGWPWSHSIYSYQFEWNETRTNEAGAEEVLARAEATDFIYVSDFTYAIVTKGAETGKGENLPVDVLSLVTVAVRNPYRALFSGEDWMRRITAAINRHVRDYIGSNSYEEFIGSGGPEVEKQEDKEKTHVNVDRWRRFSQPLIDLNEKLLDDVLPDQLEEGDPGKPPFGLRGRYGVEIRTADLQSIGLSGEGKTKTQEASTQKFVAQKAAEATRITAQAAADAVGMMGAKEAESMSMRLKVIEAYGEFGMEQARIDGMVRAGEKGNATIWAANPFAAFTKTEKKE